MALCQKLYENGFITYMRTDSETYSKEFLGLAKNYVGKKWGEDYVRPDLDKMGEKPKKKKKEEKDNNAQEAHEAIRPTDINRTELISDFSAKERKMYALIWRNTVESCMAAAKYNAITAVITAPQKKEYKYSTEQAVFPGWKVVAGYEKENAIYAYLKSLKSVDTYKKIVAKVTVKELKTHYTEAKLVQILEEKGIGRPSTFASLVEKIQERGYVKRDNVEGKKLKCIDYELEGEEMSEIENTREFGNEKNKLVIQSVGIMVIEFLLSNFEQFFDYDYTKTMENNLDKIAKNELIWQHLCRECLDDIDKTPCIQEKKQYRIDDNHVYMVGKYGPVIKYTSDDGVTTKFKNVKKDLDVTKIENGEYSLEELLEEQHSKSLGKYKGDDVFVKKGKYGYYAQCGKKTQSLARYDKDILEITLEDVVGLFGETPKDVVRPINNDVSIRKSKYGLYIYYKTPSHKKPEFISLKKFTEKVEECDSSVILEYVSQHKKK